MTTFDKQFRDMFGDATTRVLWHHSPEEYIEFLERPELTAIIGMFNNPYKVDSWCGVPYPQAIEKLRYGDDARAVLAQKLFDQIVTSDQITIGRSEMLPSIIGYVPNVPAVLAGQPETMLTRVRTDSYANNAPIRIFFDIGVSEGVELTKLIKRGVAALALTMVTKQYRPIELYTVSCSMPMLTNMYKHYTTVHVVKIETNPLDLQRAAWMLTDNAYTRRLGFHVSSYMVRDNPTMMYRSWIKWGFDSVPTSDDYVLRAREALKLEPQDIFLKGGYFFDDLMMNNPVAWVNKMIEDNRQLAEGN